MPRERSLPPTVEEEVQLLQGRVRTFAEEMVRRSASTTHKGRNIATLVIEVADCIDSIDHRTATEMGGVPENQQFAYDLRESARAFAEKFPLSD